MISCSLTYPPSANRLWRAVKGRQIKSAQYRAWVLENQRAAMLWPHIEPITGPYALSVSATAPDKRGRDLDNLIKPIGDLIQVLGLVSDDKHMRRLTAQWSDGTVAGVDITIQPIGGVS